MGTLFTGGFWRDALERAIKTAAQSMVLAWGGGVVNVLTLDWQVLGGAGLGGFALSMLTSIGTGTVRDTASLTRAVEPSGHEYRPFS